MSPIHLLISLYLNLHHSWWRLCEFGAVLPAVQTEYVIRHIGVLLTNEVPITTWSQSLTSHKSCILILFSVLRVLIKPVYCCLVTIQSSFFTHVGLYRKTGGRRLLGGQSLGCVFLQNVEKYFVKNYWHTAGRTQVISVESVSNLPTLWVFKKAIFWTLSHFLDSKFWAFNVSWNDYKPFLRVYYLLHTKHFLFIFI